MKEKVNPLVAGAVAVGLIVALIAIYRFTLYTPPPTSGVAAPANMQAQLSKPQSAQKSSGSSALMSMMAARPPVNAMPGQGGPASTDPNLAHLSPEQRRNSNQTPTMAGVPGAGVGQ